MRCVATLIASSLALRAIGLMEQIKVRGDRVAVLVTADRIFHPHLVLFSD